MTGNALLLPLSSDGGRIGQEPCAAAAYEVHAVGIAWGDKEMHWCGLHNGVLSVDRNDQLPRSIQ